MEGINLNLSPDSTNPGAGGAKAEQAKESAADQTEESKVEQKKENRTERFLRLQALYTHARVTTFNEATSDREENFNKAQELLFDKLHESPDIELDEISTEIVKLKLIRYFQNNDTCDVNVLRDAIVETPNFIKKEKGSFHRLFEVHAQKTLQKIAEMRKKRAEMSGQEEYNPYEALFTTDSGEYFVARLMNMPHLEKESEYLTHCVGTSKHYIREIEKGNIDILSFRKISDIDTENNKVDEDIPVLTMEYNRKTKTIEQIKKSDDELINDKDEYLMDVVEVIEKLQDTYTEKGQRREIRTVKDLDEVDVSRNELLTNKGYIDIVDMDDYGPDLHIYKSGRITTRGLEKQDIKKVLDNENVVLTLISRFEVQDLLGGVDEIKCGIDMGSFESADGITLPRVVGGDINLAGLINAKGLELPETVGGGLHFSQLSSAEGLILPTEVHGGLDVGMISTPRSLALPEIVGGDLEIDHIKTAKGLELPEKLGGSLKMLALKSLDGLNLPEGFSGGMKISGVSDVKGFDFPREIKGELDLYGLTDPDGANLPDKVFGDLTLTSLEHANGLRFPEYIQGELYLQNLKTAEGLILPKIVQGDVVLTSLTDLSDLELPWVVEGSIILNDTISDEQLEELRQRHKQHADKITKKGGQV